MEGTHDRANVPGQSLATLHTGWHIGVSPWTNDVQRVPVAQAPASPHGARHSSGAKVPSKPEPTQLNPSAQMTLSRHGSPARRGVVPASPVPSWQDSIVHSPFSSCVPPLSVGQSLQPAASVQLSIATTRTMGSRNTPP
jgi:hypothetical protein